MNDNTAKTKNHKSSFFIKIVLPTLLVFCLFTITIFSFIIPSVEDALLEKKREVIKELTNSSWSLLKEFDDKVTSGSLTKEEAQEEVKSIIKFLRYGENNKDYFWITDTHPTMIVHPYRSELNNSDLTNYSDPTGKKLFVECVKVVKNNGDGFVDYMWQWKDDSTKIVSKLSYVKLYKPWGWIIGTGIYIEDVKYEIAQLTKNLFYISLIILVIIGVILFFVGQQSLRIEKQRAIAEIGLKESETKYKTLVEASTEGLVMMLSGEFVYSNKTLLKILGYNDAETMDLKEILINKSSKEVKAFFEQCNNGLLPQKQFETSLNKNDDSSIDVIIYSSEIEFNNKSGFTFIIKDVSQVNEEETDSKYHTVLNTAKLGLFRISVGRRNNFIEVNSSLLKILGYSDKFEIMDKGIFDFFANRGDQKTLNEKLRSNNQINNFVLQLNKKDKSVITVSLNAILVKDDDGNIAYCDGIIKDITRQIILEEEKEHLLEDLQTSLRYLNEPVEHFIKSTVICNMNDTIHNVAKAMTEKKYSAALISTDKNEMLGIVTDKDLRERAVSTNYDLSKPVLEIMSSPLISISPDVLVFQALSYMNENSVRHLVVKENNNITGIISSEELLKIHMHSSTYLVNEINSANNVETIIKSKEKLLILINTLINSGTSTNNINQINTSIFDAIVKRLINFAIIELGEPPAAFSFIALGSAGRKEQTLISDQDNAIIFDDVDDDKLVSVQEYFTLMADKICTELNRCGYIFCPGEAMANNPKWCKPLSVWKKYFYNWVTNSSPQDLIDISIFFDFRKVFGDNSINKQLREYIFEITDGQSGFYQHLVKNCISHKPPLGLLGKIVVESKGEHPETFDIKSAILPIIDYARIYSLKNEINKQNTHSRLKALLQKGLINNNTYNEIVQAYNFLMQIRFKHHAKQLLTNAEGDNFINLNELTQIEQTTIKNAFTQIISIQKKLNYDFTGEAI